MYMQLLSGAKAGVLVVYYEEGGHIYLALQDFAPANQRDGIPALPVTIDLNDLASYVTSAEKNNLGLA